MGVTPWLSLRASRPTRAIARRLGWRLWRDTPSTLAAFAPDLLVVDDPSALDARPWVQAARRLGIAVASIHDGGRGYRATDLTIDASLTPGKSWRADLQGPAFAILDLQITRWRSPRTARRARVVLVTLGGGRHVRGIGAGIATAICDAAPRARVDVVQGFGSRPAASLPRGARWIHAPRGLARVLATSSVAVVAGGVTLSEACALGTPVVTLTVVPAQRPAARAFAAQGATLDAGSATAAGIARAARLVADLLARPHRARQLSARASALIDGHGARRVAARLHQLVRSAQEARLRYVA